MEEIHPQGRPQHHVDKYAPKIHDKTEQLQDQAATMKAALHSDGAQHEPAGGFDSTPFPHAPAGHTLKFTFHRGINLPCADFGRFTSDPYILAQMMVDLPQRHKQDPILTFRTPTVRKNRDPVWDSEWIVANVPSSGFKLRCCVFDEDAADHDDKLGNAYVDVGSIGEGWSGIHEQTFKVKKRSGSKRVYLFGNIAALASGRLDVGSHVVVSVEYLGRTPGTEGAQMYTLGPNYWFKHFSPMIGRLTGTKDELQNHNGQKNVSRYNFQAIQIQLRGPVPSELYHRYVEFRPFVAGMFTSQSLRGRILNRALHHQHQRIYNFDRTTLHDQLPSPCTELTQKFLEFVQYAQGGRIFTYVLTLDAQFRFTETGKEFGVDLLSKHTMHSNVSIYIAYSGEFFLRRRKNRQKHQSAASPISETEIPVEESPESPEVSTDPDDYELYIDNDSGTYRPNGQCLHLLKQFISANFPGLHVTTLDCQDDAERMAELKDEQREFKKSESGHMTFLQQSSTSSLSISSSDEEELDERSGLRTKKRGEFSQKVHDMRDVKGQMMKWAQADEYRAKSAGNSSAYPGNQHAPVRRDREAPLTLGKNTTVDERAAGYNSS
ncbi:C2 domain protein [Aspergillus candidus]|uniref:C2 domain protein n=1 Tax=Aspergillus candidus TaxID=41067 RepID=A0A2I2F7U3_ASPCN|nr:C2 domain protein [Aspergillus candidus]PLB36697.1 C2 domain protein [Aspergillus candidus]